MVQNKQVAWDLSGNLLYLYFIKTDSYPKQRERVKALFTFYENVFIR